ncbi:trypsin-like peptidase domain-containing protein [Pseudonocardia sp. CA-107938]|uniref:trypsin-like peptidase domain-containing protein n=1 Tax=Pseudonocardia sp. CA-107938 TaxID=3240021 RepID=UPI003D92370A
MGRSRWAGAVSLALLAGPVLGGGIAHAEPVAGGPPPVTAVERTATLVRPAIVRVSMKVPLRIEDPTGTLLTSPVVDPEYGGTCTGFGINPDGLVATAGHCVDTTTPDGLLGSAIETVARQVVAADPSKSLADVYKFAVQNWKLSGPVPGSPLELTAKVTVGSLDGGRAPVTSPATIVGYRPAAEGDAALLKIDVKDLPTLPLAADADVRIGSDVLAVGFPGSADTTTDTSLEPSNKDGRISSKKTVKGVPFYEMSAALAHGMSGGPVVDMQGRVVGINSWNPVGETSAINFMATSDTLASLVAAKGEKAASGRVDDMFRRGVDDYYAGRFTAAIADFDQLLAVSPGQAQAEQLRTAALAARAKYGDPLPAAPAPARILGLEPLLFWVLAGAAGLVLLIVLALVIAAVRRRRRRRAVEQPWRGAPDLPPVARVGVPYPPRYPQPLDPRWAPGPTMRAPAPMATATLPSPFTCRHCPAPVPPGAAFCPACGRPQHRGAP